MTPERIKEKHLHAVAELEKAVFGRPWSENALSLLCTGEAFGFAVMAGETAAAYGGMLTVLDEGQITNIATHPDFRRRGLAAAVLSALLTEARARGLAFLTLEVRESNAAAISLYEKFGFRAVGRRPHFYQNPTEAATVMECRLSAEN